MPTHHSSCGETYPVIEALLPWQSGAEWSLHWVSEQFISPRDPLLLSSLDSHRSDMTDQDKWLGSEVRSIQSRDCPRQEQKATLSTRLNSLSCLFTVFVSLLRKWQKAQISYFWIRLKGRHCQTLKQFIFLFLFCMYVSLVVSQFFICSETLSIPSFPPGCAMHPAQPHVVFMTRLYFLYHELFPHFNSLGFVVWSLSQTEDTAGVIYNRVIQPPHPRPRFYYGERHKRESWSCSIWFNWWRKHAKGSF